MSVIFAKGPLTKEASQDEAITSLKKSPAFPKDAELTVKEIDGRWVAAVHVADGPPFGAPADDAEEAPGPKSEGPGDTAPDEGSDEGAPDDSDGPPKDGDEHKEKDEKGGDKAILLSIHDALQKLMVALGIPDEDPGAGPVPGEDGPPAPPGPPGAGGPPPPQEKPLKPGEAPPGATPVGAPSFSSVHPWSSVIGKVASFELEERIPEDHKLSAVDHELQQLAHGTIYKVKQLQESRNEQGHRIARALISVH